MRQWTIQLLAVLLLHMLSVPPVAAGPFTQVTDLAAAGELASHQGKVFVLYISREQCPYCARLEKDVLDPMFRSQQYDALITLQELSFESPPVTDFNGKQVPAIEIISRYQVIGTPTLLFLDQHGHQVTAKIEGYQSVDYYWYYLEQSINAATEKLFPTNQQLIRGSFLISPEHNDITFSQLTESHPCSLYNEDIHPIANKV